MTVYSGDLKGRAQTLPPRVKVVRQLKESSFSEVQYRVTTEPCFLHWLWSEGDNRSGDTAWTQGLVLMTLNWVNRSMNCDTSWIGILPNRELKIYAGKSLPGEAVFWLLCVEVNDTRWRKNSPLCQKVFGGLKEVNIHRARNWCTLKR